MNKKISVGLALAITIVAIAVTFTLTMAMSRTLYNSIITNLSLRTSVSAAIEEINGIVSNYYYGSVDDRTSVITSTLVEGYVNGLGDSGNGYLSSEEYAEYTERLNGGLTGIGIETYYNPVTSEYSVVYVYEDSPAEKAGLQKGDVIVSIEGEKVTRINYQELEKQLYGGKLSSVEIVYSRDGKQSTVEPMLGFEIPTVVSQMLSGNIAKVRITAFYKDTPAEFESVMKSLQEKGAVGFIIDLRGTSEGTVEYAARTLDVIVPAPSGNQTLAVTYDKNGSKIDAYAAESGSINSTFAVLVN
ncbi:MAG: PDZ domain-containing protein, partial [Clostridia bacterium]|nr:PDZ domain-containing protein [Clostridia bacterium]